MPEDFEGAIMLEDILLPESVLSDVSLNLLGLHMVALETEDFPPQWEVDT